MHLTLSITLQSTPFLNNDCYQQKDYKHKLIANSVSSPQASVKDYSTVFHAAQCIIWHGQPLKYIAGFCFNILVLIELRMPEVLSTTEVHNDQTVQKISQFCNMYSFSSSTSCCVHAEKTGHHHITFFIFESVPSRLSTDFLFITLT